MMTREEPKFCGYCGRQLIERPALSMTGQIFMTCPKLRGWFPERSKPHTDFFTGREMSLRFHPQTGDPR